MEASTKVKIGSPYHVSLELDKLQTKVFVWYGEDVLKCIFLAGMSPTKDDVLKVAINAIEIHEMELANLPALKKLENEVNRCL